MSVLICGGGTGGHINPGIAIASELKSMGIAVAWLGTADGMEESMVPEAGFELRTVAFKPPAGGMAGYLACLARLVPAAYQARRVLKELNVKVALGLGGYPSLPGMCAAFGGLARRVIHEQNVLPGLANRLLAPMAHAVLTSHEGTFSGSAPIVTGNPLRPEFSDCEEPQRRFAGRSGKLRLLVMGGSQGASTFNTGLPSAVAQAKSDWTVEHATGSKGDEAVAQAYAKAGVEAEVQPYFKDVARRMSAADLLVCRAGAGTVAELASVGAASVLVPYPHAGQHQRFNAEVLAKEKAALVLDDAKAGDAESMARVLDDLGDRKKLLQMASRAHALGHRTAAHKVALICAKEMVRAA